MLSMLARDQSDLPGGAEHVEGCLVQRGARCHNASGQYVSTSSTPG
jgi:hypothetical protein